MQEAAHRAARDAALAALGFAHEGFRPGQRQLAAAVYNAARSGRCLLAQAPTGIGKTIGTIFPALKACPGQSIDKLFFLTARGSGRRLAFDALDALGGPHGGSGRPAMALRCRRRPPLPLRIVELVARDNACEHPDKACHGESCPLARGFHDRLPAARAAAVAPGAPLDRAALRTLALRHEVCPYHLGQELVRWADVVVADYNHWFDGSALLHALAVADGWRVAVLVDEAHNLVERARAMYSAELDRARLRSVRRAVATPLKTVLGRLDRCWGELQGDQQEPWQAYPQVPARFTAALQQAVATIAEGFEQAPADERPDGELLQLHFDLLRFSRLLESFGGHSLFDITLAAPGTAAGTEQAQSADSVLCLRNVVPAPFLEPRWAAARSTTLFSATLGPPHYYRDTLGLPADTGWLDVGSPFDEGQLAVRIAGHVSTRFRHRDASLAPIVELMQRQYAERPGNYLAFFSSFDYLDKVAALFAARHPEVPVWRQSRAMDGVARDAFLARFAEGGQGIGFAVLGGSFGEGIDLPGSRLVGAFVATLGLPPLNPVNEHMKRRLDEVFGAGYDYAYLFPGLRKVVQAAGRVIRTPEDRGVVVLIDDRYARADVRRLLPGWWGLSKPSRGAAAGAA